MIIVTVSGIVLPRLLTPEALGRLNTFLATAAIVYSITFLGMRSSLVMHLGKEKFSNADTLRALRFVFLLSSSLSTLALLFFFFVLSSDSYPPDIILLVALINPFAFIIAYMQGYNLASGQIAKFNQLKWLPAALYLLAILLFVGLLGWAVRGALIATILSNIVSIILYISMGGIKTGNGSKGPPPWPVIRSLLAYGSLYALAYLATRLNHKIDILLMKRLCELKEVGFYSLGANVAETLWQVPIAIGLMLMTRTASEKDERNSTNEVCASLRISLLLVASAAVLLYLFAPVLVALLFGERYAASVPVIRTILPGILFFVILKILNSQFIGSGKPQLTLIALLPALLLNIAANLILIPRYGGRGAALATDLSYLGASLLLLLVYSKTFGIGPLEVFHYRKSDFVFLKKLRFKK